MLRLNLEMPMLLDHISNEVDIAYSALPERLFFLDEAGVIRWSCGMGPFGFDPDGWEKVIREHLDATS